MSFGLSVGDVRIVWQLAVFLHEKCFSKQWGADVQYLRFGREIEYFADNLHQLVAVIEHANCQRPRRPWGNTAYDCRLALQPLSEAVGDFQKTLKECEILLNDHDRFQRDTAGFVDNVQWHMGTQRDVEILRDRVHFHAVKLLVLLKPFELQLLLEIRRELQDLRREVAEIKGLLVTVLANGKLPDGGDYVDSDACFPEISADIERRFSDAAKRDAPKPTFDATDLPLREGFDALVSQFAKSTVEFNPGLDLSQKVPDETQFLNLLKSRWIMQKLESSKHFQSAGPVSLWAAYLRELKSDIMREFARFNTNQLVAPSNNAITRLPDQCFSIWVTEGPPLQPPGLTEQRPLEDLVLELDLPESVGSRKRFLSVFRRSPIEFRMVTTTKDLNNPDYHQEKEFIANTDSTRVIPAYATPGNGVNANNILLSSSHVHDLRWQYLSSAVDVDMMQQALIGYRVHHSISGVSWSLNGSSKPGKSAKGSVQLWQLQTLPSMTERADDTFTQSSPSISNPSVSSPSVNSPSVSSPKSPAGSPSLRRASTALSTASTTFSGTSMTSVVTGSQGNGTAVRMPEPPVMVIFTVFEGKYAFLHLNLHPYIFVNPERCNCRKNSKKNCRIVVLETKTKDKAVEIRRLCSLQASEKGLYTWDLARFRMPRHPEYGSVEVVPKVKYITLEFHTDEEKDVFCKELRLLERVRALELESYYEFLDQKREKDRKPGRR